MLIILLFSCIFSIKHNTLTVWPSQSRNFIYWKTFFKVKFSIHIALSLISSILFLSWNLQFLRSEFRGQLPKPYSSGEDATKIIPTDMNDLNREEMSRYVSVNIACVQYGYVSYVSLLNECTTAKSVYCL